MSTSVGSVAWAQLWDLLWGGVTTKGFSGSASVWSLLFDDSAQVGRQYLDVDREVGDNVCSSTWL